MLLLIAVMLSGHFLRMCFETDLLAVYFCCLQAFEHLQSFIAECDRKMEGSKKRLKETQEELSEEQTAKVCHLCRHFFYLYVQVYCKYR